MGKAKRKTKRAAPAAPADAQTDGRVNWLTVRGARHNNLDNLDVHFPLGRFVCVTGVSGSGKSSLVNDILRERLAGELNDVQDTDPGDHDAIEGLDALDKIIDINQSPIGRTPRSNPATYIKVFDEIRRLYSQLPDAKVRGYQPGRFSFNVATGPKGGGRCESCEGNGANRIEMDFLADVWVPCPVCGGRRFSRETLQVCYKHRSIADVLGMDVQEALEHFANVPRIERMLATLHRVGLDYIKLGQSSTTLSGGEAQRIKLARELVKRSTGRTLYLLDEPTTGLHFDDVAKLLTVLHGFVDDDNTVIVIEHNVEVIKTADWIIDLGPEGGDAGGRIIATGTPEQVAANPASATGRALEVVLTPAASRRSGRGAPRKPTRSRRRDNRLNEITVVGARQHNLKDITVSVPRDRLTVCSGVSGSGKSSFALDTIYAEGQRRYVESLSAYARQFVGQLAKPQVDHVYGLSPAIAIEQKAASKSPRSTVGTVTEIYDYMRVLWARLGQPYCPQCDLPIGAQSAEQIVDQILTLGEGVRALLLAPIERTGAETFPQLFARHRAAGFARVCVDSDVFSLDDAEIPVDHRRRHTVELVVDRVVIRPNQRSRIADSVEQALTIGDGVIVVQPADDDARRRTARPKRRRFSQHYACDGCSTSYEELTPHHFSFNSRLGWCPACDGLGTQQGAAASAVVVRPNASILDGAILGWGRVREKSMLARSLAVLADGMGFELETPWNQLTSELQHGFLHGTGDRWYAARRVAPGLRFQWKGLFPALDEAAKASWKFRDQVEHLVTEVACDACSGSRLRPDAVAVRLDGKTIDTVVNLTLDQAAEFFKAFRLDRRTKRIAGEVLHELRSRLRFLLDVGLDYLTLHRSAATLSGGEAQRIRLASQIGSGLTGVLYVLDEPTIGLHPRDNRRLIGALDRLRDLGNTLLMVEHDREVIDHADFVIDFGPGAGQAGGRVVAQGTPRALRRQRESLTGAYLAGRDAIVVPTNRRPVPRNRRPDDNTVNWLEVRGARQHNLNGVDVAFPLGRFTVVTGVSGSGKSSLVNEILYPALAQRIHRARTAPGHHDEIIGLDHVDKVINVDQSPIGNAPSSNPATYTGTFDLLRELYTKLPESRIRGYTANRFSFNRPGGRCEACEGNGCRRVEMHFLPDVWIECEDCKGARYKPETLEVRYRGRSIADVLNMSVAHALEHFENIPKVRRKLQTLADVGLGYVHLGQSAPTLSGGEAQRVKLAGELARPSTGKTVYILDEPTTGLHFDDLKKLLAVLNRLVDQGNSVICIEHNLDVVKTADWCIDLGPEAGHAGGDVVVEGTPEHVAECERSHTGRILADILRAGPHERRPDSGAPEAARDHAVVLAETDTGATDVDMPWTRDGEAWHTRTRTDRQGRPIQWEGAALAWLVDRIQTAATFARTEWNHPSRVEIKAPKSGTLWFFHALTAGRWLLDTTFRVPTGTFDAHELNRELALKTLDQRDDLPVYGPEPRVRIRRAFRGFEDVRIHIHDRAEVDTPAFRRFVKKAAVAHQGLIAERRAAPERAEPWKTDGRAWHLSQQPIAPNKPRLWKPMTLVELLGRIQKLQPAVEPDWRNKATVTLTVGKPPTRIGRIVTNHGHGLRVDLRVPAGLFTPTQLESIGQNPTLRTAGNETQISFWLQRLDQLNVATLATVLDAAVAPTRDRSATA